jgi:hypothetical protein
VDEVTSPFKVAEALSYDLSTLINRNPLIINKGSLSGGKEGAKQVDMGICWNLNDSMDRVRALHI